MRQRRVNVQNLGVGLAYTLIGGAFAWASAYYPAGTPADMGPGFFPFWLGVILTGLGALIVLRAVAGALAEKRDPEAEVLVTSPWDWRSMFWVVGALVGFGLSLKTLGLFAAVTVLVVLASMASPEFRLRTALAGGVGLAGFNALVFAYGLSLPLAVWPQL